EEKESYDSEGRPLTNTNRLNVDLSKKKEKKERLDNYSRLEVSAEKKKKDSITRKPGSRKHDRVLSSKKKRKESYDSEGRPLTNTSRLKVAYENNKLKYKENEEYDPNKYMERYNTFNKTKTQYGTLKATPASNKYYQPGKKPTSQIASSYNYPSTAKKPTTSSTIQAQSRTQIKKYPTVSDYKQKSQTKTSDKKNKPYGVAPDYQQYSLGSRTQQQGFNKGTNVSYGISSSQFNTASTMPRDSKRGRMNKSVEGSMEFYSGDTFKNNTIYQSSANQKPYGQSTVSLYTQPKYTQTKDKKKDVPSSQRFSSAPKKPIQVSSSTKPKGVESGYLQTPTQKPKLDQYKRNQQSQQNIINKYKPEHPSAAKGKSYLKTDTYPGQKNKKGDDNIKLDLSKYLQDKTPQSKKQKDKKSKKQTQEIEIYEYYPLSKTVSKPDTYNKQKQPSSSSNKYQSKASKIDKNKTPKTTAYDDLYEYNPVTKIFEYKPKKNMDQRKGVAQSTEPGYKGSLNRSTTSTNLMKNRPMSINLDKYTYDRKKPDSYLTTVPKKTIKTPSYSYQKDKIVTYADNAKGSQSKNNRYLFSPFLDESKNNELQRNHGIQNTSSNLRHSMAFFKCKFLTTKEVCEKFWKSIDTGELSSLMFEPNGFSTRNSGNASSKLSNFLSPEKNRFSKFSNKNSNSNENTEYTNKNSKNSSGFGKNKKMSYSNSESNFKNFGDVRHSYKVGYN
ncbi:MAG: hypothetical protein J6I85_08450, partial [Clostridia bacterium]|nr:hypothetical protein [Clostridia bacterium]